MAVIASVLSLVAHILLVQNTEGLVEKYAAPPFVAPVAYHTPAPISSNSSLYDRMMEESQDRIRELEALGANQRSYEEFREKYVTPRKEQIDVAVHLTFAVVYLVLGSVLIVLLRRQVQEIMPKVDAKFKTLASAASAGLAKLKDFQIVPDRKLEIAAKELENAKKLHSEGLLSDARLEAKKQEIRARLEQ